MILKGLNREDNHFLISFRTYNSIWKTLWPLNWRHCVSHLKNPFNNSCENKEWIYIPLERNRSSNPFEYLTLCASVKRNHVFCDPPCFFISSLIILCKYQIFIPFFWNPDLLLPSFVECSPLLSMNDCSAAVFFPTFSLFTTALIIPHFPLFNLPASHCLSRLLFYTNQKASLHFICLYNSRK